MRKIYIRFVLFLCLISAASCEMTVDVDLPKFDPVLVLNARLETGKPALVDLTASRDVLTANSGEFPPVRDAEVTLIRNGTDTFRGSFFQPLLQYTFPILPKPGDYFKIIASHPDYSSVTAETRVPSLVDLHNVKLTRNADTDINGHALVRVNFDLDDPEAEQNFYSMEVFYVGPDSVRNRACFESGDPVFYEGGFGAEPGSREYFCDEVYFEDALITAHPYFMEIYLPEDHLPGLKFILIVLHLHDRAWYLYQRSLMAQLMTYGNPFAEPALVFNNIEGGLGIFAASSSVEAWIEL